MRWCFLAAAVAPHKYEFIRNGSSVFERGENSLQNGISNFAFKYEQSCWKVKTGEKATFQKGAWH